VFAYVLKQEEEKKEEEKLRADDFVKL